MLTPEFELVRASAPYPLRPEEGLRVAELGRDVNDWNTVLALVKRHNIHPTAYLNLERYGNPVVPDAIIQQLKLNYERGKLRSLALVAELLRVKDAFEPQSIPVVPLKGPILAQQIFGDIGLRTSGDLDLLVPSAAFSAASQVIQTLGYQLKEPLRPLTPKQWQAYTILNHHTSYYHPGKRILLELHWSLANRYLMPLPATQAVMTRLRTVNYFGADFNVLSLEDSFAYLLLHGAKHSWARLKWILDLDAFTRSGLPIDWEKMAASLVSLNLRRPIAQGFLMAQRAINTPIPAIIKNVIRAEPNGALLAQDAWQVLTASEDYLRETGAFVQWKQTLNMARLKPNSTARWSYLAAFLLHSLNDWDDFPLSDALFPLYYVIRPFTWFWRYFIRRRHS